MTDVMATEEYYNGGNNVSYGGNGGNNPAVQQVAAEVEKPAVRIKVSLLASMKAACRII